MTGRGTGSAFAGFRFPPEVIAVAVRWYLRYGLSYRDVEELLAERGVVVDHVSVYRWVQRFTPEFVSAARACRHVPGDRWFVDETYVRVAGWGVSVPGGRPAWAGRRRVAVGPPRPARRPGVLRAGDHERVRPGRGDHRPCAGLSAGSRRGGAGRAARHRAVR